MTEFRVRDCAVCVEIAVRAVWSGTEGWIKKAEGERYERSDARGRTFDSGK